MKFTVCLSKSGACPGTGLCPGCQRQDIGYGTDICVWLNMPTAWPGFATVLFDQYMGAFGGNLCSNLPPEGPLTTGDMNFLALAGWTAEGGINLYYLGGNAVFQPTNENFSAGDTPIGYTALEGAPVTPGTTLGKLGDAYVAGCQSNELILQS